MLILLYGTDTWRSRQYLKKMTEKFHVDRDRQGLNLVRLDAEKEDAGKIMGEILASPFLAERRMIVIENLCITKKSELQKELLARSEEKRLPDSNILIFWEGVEEVKGKDAKALFTHLAEEKYSQRFDEMKGIKLGGWIAAEVSERGGKISSEAAQYLVTEVAGDMWRLHTLLDQLIAYADGTDIELPMIQLFLDERADDNIFNLVDAIVGRQMKDVFAMIQAQYQKGEDVQYIYAMILRQFRILLEIRDLFEREDQMPSDLIAKRLELHPFVVKKSLPIVKRYTLAQLKEVYRELLDLDVHIKTGYAEPETLLDVFVGRLCVT